MGIKPSYRTIDYYLRSAKTIERNMILEVLKDLCKVNNKEEYQYVGMGSVAFIDFRSYHKEIGFTNMTSIEKSSDVKRFDFNIPFNCIKMVHDWSYNALPKINLSKQKSIVWLDYDGIFENYILDDAQTVATKVIKNSLYLVTWNKSLRNYVDSSKFGDEKFKDEIEEAVESFNTKFSLRAKKSDFTPKKEGDLIRNLIYERIQDTLKARNSSRPTNEKIHFKQIFYFEYSDGTPMQTLGGVFVSEEDLKVFEKSIFLNFDFIVDDDKCYKIEIPQLTKDEVSLLNKHLPAENLAKFLSMKDLKFIPQKEKEMYYKLYRYFPNFMNVQY